VTYSVYGEALTRTAPNGVATPTPNDYRAVLTYDRNGRLRTATDPEGNLIEYTYDPDGNLKTVKSPDLAVTTLHYDDADQLVRVELRQGRPAPVGPAPRRVLPHQRLRHVHLRPLGVGDRRRPQRRHP
jgi:YD repeat-containing protein